MNGFLIRYWTHFPDLCRSSDAVETQTGLFVPGLIPEFSSWNYLVEKGLMIQKESIVGFFNKNSLSSSQFSHILNYASGAGLTFSWLEILSLHHNCPSLHLHTHSAVNTAIMRRTMFTLFWGGGGVVCYFDETILSPPLNLLLRCSWTRHLTSLCSGGATHSVENSGRGFTVGSFWKQCTHSQQTLLQWMKL